jgi:hypothetical protein
MLSYLKEINYPSLVEHIDEKFDNISVFMTPYSVIYGSSLTSLISGINSDGDLDLSVSSLEFKKLVQKLADSTKWVQTEGSPIRESRGSSTETLVWQPSLSKNPYNDIPDFPVSQVVAFKTINGAKVQIIQSKMQSGDPLEDALSPVRKVDFAFCGIAMDRYGRLLEALPNAFSDCQAGIIRISNYRSGYSKERMRQRLDKYVRRGWSLSISYDQAFKNLADAQPKPKSKSKSKDTSKKVWRVSQKDGTTMLIINAETVGLYGGSVVSNYLSQVKKEMGLGASFRIEIMITNSKKVISVHQLEGTWSSKDLKLVLSELGVRFQKLLQKDKTHLAKTKFYSAGYKPFPKVSSYDGTSTTYSNTSTAYSGTSTYYSTS